jgi:cytochrome c oxidase cbb3-type subunit 4
MLIETTNFAIRTLEDTEMTHQAATVLSQTVALVLFVALFVGVLIYVFWPGNKKKFDAASKLPLDDEKNDKPGGEGRS